MNVVYILKNKTNGMCYVGQTKNWKNRRRGHKFDAKRFIYPINLAIKEFGMEGFEEIFYEVPKEQMDCTEKEMIVKYNSLFPNGYNLDAGGVKARKKHPLTKQRHSMANHSEETKEKIRQSKLGISTKKLGQRTEHLCMCGKIMKEHFSNGEFKGYNKTCGNKECIKKTHNTKKRELKAPYF
jgi:group I intron endonuclease